MSYILWYFCLSNEKLSLAFNISLDTYKEILIHIFLSSRVKKLLKHIEKDVLRKVYNLYTSVDIGKVNEICDSSKSLLEILKGEKFNNIGECIIFRPEMEYSVNQSTGNRHKHILQCNVLPGKLIQDDSPLLKEKCTMGLGST